VRARPRLLPVALVVALAAASIAVVRNPRLPPAERGRRTGCFACHGADGQHGAANPGRTDRTVPEFGDDLMMYAKTPGDVRAWIRDGAPAARRASRTWREQRQRGALKMPAFRSRLSGREIDDLVAFVEAISERSAPEDTVSSRGLERARALGCTGCHGAGGTLAHPNPGSFKGYVPSWGGSDFPELVRDRAEFDEWVRRGVSRRFERTPGAAYFLRRAVLRMPAFERYLAPGDLDTLWAYVVWLRSPEGREPRVDSSAVGQAGGE